jgi:hypothetical protein
MSFDLHGPNYIPDDLLDAQATFRHAMHAKIGQGLGALYQVPQDVPDDMLKLLLRVINSSGK